MKNVFYMIFASLLVGATITGCATPRTKWSDPGMKVMISPEGISAAHYVKIQNALVESGKFVVIDRGQGFSAIKTEQAMEYRQDFDRYEDREKLARWGKLHGVGGVIIAHADCIVKDGWFLKKNYVHCHEYLAILDTVTAKIMATAQQDENGDSNEYDNIAPSWDSCVAQLESNYPARFDDKPDEKNLREYKDMVQEEAKRQKESSVREPASDKKE